MEKKVPVILVTGFLGAGKTTFLNWLINTHPNLKISLILNEFGDVKLESQFIKQGAKNEVVELANGCMCCVAKSDIPRVIKLILEKSPKTEYILIEASGLSDPDPIHETLESPDLSEKVYLSSVICIVDAVNFEKTRESHQIVMSQIGDANIIILSKIKEAGEEKTLRIKSFIEGIGINTRVVLWNESLSPDMFLEKTNLPKEIEDKKVHEHRHSHEEYDDFLFKSNKEIDIEKFIEVVNSLPENIVRAKGYLLANGRKKMVQYVSGQLEIFDEQWGNQTPNTAILFLGKNMEKEKLAAILQSCEIN